MKAISKQTETYIDERGYNPALESLLEEGVRNKPWTVEDEDTLKKYYGKVKTAALVKQLGRTRASVASKVREFDLHFEKKESSPVILE